MTLEEFAKTFRQDVLARSESSPNFEVDVFTEEVIDAITDSGEADGAIICNCDGRGFKVNAYNVSSDGDCIDLFVTLYTGADTPERVSRTDVDRHFTRLRGFFTKCLTSSFRAGLEESSPEFDAAHSIHAQRQCITRGRLFLLTDGMAATREYDDEDAEGIHFSHHVWDIERVYRIQTSGAEREKIDVWFERDFGGRVTCIRAIESGREYSTFIGFFPAPLLVRIYERYGARLLERNVRSFLQARGKINRGIRDTILKEPQRFLAYNNGISATAEQIDYEVTDGDVVSITRAAGFQIVNGGQTTASLYAAVKKDKADIANVFVQVKLTMPTDARIIDELAPKISLYANSQNKVNTADFSANHSFHQAIENLSRTIWAPAVSGSQLETKWYYERARGSYLDELGRAGTASERTRWKLQNPVSQKFTKTDLAKFEHTWDQLPHLVSRGAEKNFVEFMAYLPETRLEKPDDAYFKRLISKAILFRRAEKLIQAQKFGGYRANIVTYTLAWLSHHTAQRIDLDQIWRMQTLLPELDEVIRIVSKPAYDHLVAGAQGGNVTEWAKRERCWDSFRRVAIPLSPNLIVKVCAPDGLTTRARRTTTEAGDATGPEFDEVKQLNAEAWFALAHWAKETMNLEPWQRSLAFSMGRVKAKNLDPSIKQLRQAAKILDEVRRLGFQGK